MRIRKPRIEKPLPKLSDAEYIELIRKFNTGDYPAKDDLKILNLLDAHYPITVSYKAGMTPEENLQAAKDRLANRSVICL